MSNPVPASMQYLNGRFGKFDLEAGVGLLHFEPTEAMCNPTGAVQGGMIAAMLDDVCGMITWAAGGNRPFTTGNMTVDFLRGAFPGDKLVGEGRIVRAGRRQCVVDAVIRREGEDDPIARATCYQVYLDTDKAAGEGKSWP